MNDAIDLVPADKFLEKAQKIRERGEIRVKKGEMNLAEEDFFLSEEILKNLDQTLEGKRSKIKRDYILGMTTIWCSDLTIEDLEGEK